jgi:hypothetical protein
LKEEKEEEGRKKMEEELRRQQEAKELKERQQREEMEKKREMEMKEKEKKRDMEMKEKVREEQKQLPRPVLRVEDDKPLLFKKIQRVEPKAVAPVVVMLESVAASLQGSLQGAYSILEMRLQENMEWCDAVLQGLRNEQQQQSALSSMRFGRYPDVLSPGSYEPVSEAAKRTLRRTLRKSPHGNNRMEEELAAIREEKTRLEQEVATLRGAKADKSHDRKLLEAELESARVELNAIKRGRVEDALRRRAAIGTGARSGPAFKKMRSPDKEEAVAVVVRRPSPPKNRKSPLRRNNRIPIAANNSVVMSPIVTSSVSCTACQGAISGTGVKFEEMEFHKECFKCASCNVGLIGKNQVIAIADLP